MAYRHVFSPRDHLCPTGYQWYKCQKNGFAGCCSELRVCDLDDGCPAGKEVADLSPDSPPSALESTWTTGWESKEPATTVQATRMHTETRVAKTTQPVGSQESNGSTPSSSAYLTSSNDGSAPGSIPATLATISTSPTNGEPLPIVPSTTVPLSPANRKSSAALVGGVIGAVIVAIMILCLFLYITSSRRKKKREAECKRTSAEKDCFSGAGGGVYSQEALNSPASTKDHGLQTPTSPGFPAPAYTAQHGQHVDDDPVPHLDSREITPEVELPGPIPLPHPPPNILELPNSEVSSPITPTFKISNESPVATTQLRQNHEPTSASAPSCRLSYPPAEPHWPQLDSTNAGIMASKLPIVTGGSDDRPPSGSSSSKRQSPAPGMFSGASLSPPLADSHVMAWAEYDQVDGAGMKV